MPERLRASMAQGLSFEASCGTLGINKDTGYTYIDKYEEFRAAKIDGETLGQLFWERAAIDNLISMPDFKFNATIWIFTMKNRFSWRDKKEITGAGGAPLLGDPTGAQVDDRISAILARLPPELMTMANKKAPAADKLRPGDKPRAKGK